MTTSSTTNKALFNGNGTTVVFPANIKIFEKTDLNVSIIDAATDVELRVLTLDDLGADGFSLSFDTDDETLSVTTNSPPAVGERLFMLRSLPVTQETNFPRATRFPSEATETLFDRSVVIIQDLSEQVSRSLVTPPQSEGSDLSIGTLTDGEVVTYDGQEGTILTTGISATEFSQAVSDVVGSAAASEASETASALAAAEAEASRLAAEAAASSVSTEGIQDTAGGLFDGNAETNISSSYDDSGKKVTLSVPNASTAVRGAVELADNAETIAGVDDERAVTPAGLQMKFDTISGGRDVISVQDVTNATDVEFDLTGDYTYFEIHFNGLVSTVDDARLDALFSKDGIAYETGASDYSWGARTFQVGGLFSQVDGSDSKISLSRQSGGAGLSNLPMRQAHGIIIIVSANNHATVECELKNINSANISGMTSAFGRYLTDADRMDSFKILAHNGGVTGTFTLYGVV